MKKITKNTDKDHFLNMTRGAAVTGKSDHLKSLMSINTKSQNQFQEFLKKPRQLKPGLDLYYLIAFSQFLIILYTIIFFTPVERDFSNRLPESYTLQQFSEKTVYTVFIMILVISVDRHIYLTKKFEILREKKKDGGEDSDHQDDITESDEYHQKKITKAIKIIINQNPNKVKKYSMRSALAANQNSLLFKKEDEGSIHEDDVELIDYDKRVKPLRYAIIWKYILQIFMVLFVHGMLFWYIPMSSNIQTQNKYYCDEKSDNYSKCNESNRNPFLTMYYLLFWFYFTVSALQLNYGYPELISGNFLMQKSTSMTGVGYSVFTYIPFLLEMKVITEWFETNTALTLLQWMKFQIIYGDLFMAKNKSEKTAKKIGLFTKILMGFGGIIAMIAILAGPLILFSTLNPANEINLVTGAKLELSIEMEAPGESEAINKYNLFTSDHVNVLREIRENFYNDLDLKSEPSIRSFDRSLVQEVWLSPNSDSNWDITPPSQIELYNQIQSSRITGAPITLKLDISFVRKEPAGSQIVTNSTYIKVRSQPDSEKIIQALEDAVNPLNLCTSSETYSFTLSAIYCPTIFLSGSPDPTTIPVKDLNVSVVISKS